MNKHQVKAIAEATKTIMSYLNLDPKESGLLETPMRFAKFLAEYNNPIDLVELLKTFDAGRPKGDVGDPVVVQTRIPFRGLCEHHLLPFLGHASIGYIPNKIVVGLSKLTRLVDAAGTRRPSIQERITHDIADALMDYLECQGVMVVISAEHMCMACRGVTMPNVITTTSVVRGLFRNVPELRGEFFELIKHQS